MSPKDFTLSASSFSSALMGESTTKEFDELIEGYIERGGPDAVSFTAFGKVLMDLEAESVSERSPGPGREEIGHADRHQIPSEQAERTGQG